MSSGGFKLNDDGFFDAFGYNKSQFLAQVFGSWTDRAHVSSTNLPLGQLLKCVDENDYPLTYPPSP